jgi:hypothetical protein
MNQDTPTFKTKTEAMVWMIDKELEYNDNFRFCFLDDPAGRTEYEYRRNQGCCGYFDAEIIVDGRPAKIGCNYGH